MNGTIDWLIGVVAQDRARLNSNLVLFMPVALRSGVAVLTDKRYAGGDPRLTAQGLAAWLVDAARNNEPHSRLHLSTIRQRIQSIL